MSPPQFLLFQVYPCLPLNSCYIQQGQYFFCFLGTLLSLLTAPKICTADSSHNGCETGEIQCEQQKIWKFPWNIWVLQIFISEIPWQESVALRLLRILFSTCRADKQGGQGNANSLCFPLSSHPRGKGWSATFQSQQGKNLGFFYFWGCCWGFCECKEPLLRCPVSRDILGYWLLSWLQGCVWYDCLSHFSGQCTSHSIDLWLGLSENNLFFFDRACVPADLQVSSFEL